MARTPEQQAADFVDANRRSLVVEGRAIGNGGEGAYYTLADRSVHRLGARACELLPKGFPKWRLS